MQLFSGLTLKDKVCSLLSELKAVDSQQSHPLWPELIEVPVPIDRTGHDPEVVDEEFVYWAN